MQPAKTDILTRESASDKAAAVSTSANRFERVGVLIFDDSASLALQVATRIATLINAKRAAGNRTVLGLPTGSTPIGVYQELVRMHREDGLDFSGVVTFNLDEYYPMEPSGLQSYHRFMWENLFDQVNIDEANIYIPDGRVPRERVEAYCLEYEHAIRKAGGIDLMLLGIGRSGHIGFNEPGSGRDDRTRIIVLDEITRKDAASDFFEERYVPREALTMGVGTILEAREIILMANGEHKAPIIRRAVEEEPSPNVSASYLQSHKNATFYIDRASASDLTREQTPWLVQNITWDAALAKRAIVWLSQKSGKAINQLDAVDFHRNHLHDLANVTGSVDDLCQQVFKDISDRIYSSDRLPREQKILVFSPHPDDDVISMGGMLGALVENQNDLTVAYMTNGSVAVFDEDVLRHLRFLEMVHERFGDPAATESVRAMSAKIRDALEIKEPAAIDSGEVQTLKALIRYTEAISAIEVLGLGAEHARFLDMPFYKTGRVQKAPVGEADVAIIDNLFAEIKPAHIFVAGDLSDPHGTHRMCYSAIRQALKRYTADARQNSDRLRPVVWLYRGAWQEWEIDRADVFLPLTRAEIDRKIEAIFKHESQKDRALFPGAYDEREFWQRARDRNLQTAEALDALGMPEFHAAEAFVTAYDMP